MDERIYLSPPYLTGAEEKHVKNAFAQNWIAPMGPDIKALEAEISNSVGVKHAVALCSGTAAIHLSLLYLGISPGDTVLCPSFTFIGSCNPVHYLGAEPVFVDSEQTGYGMCPKAAKRALSELDKRGRLPKAAVIVDLYGHPANMGALLPLFESYGIPVIEDAAEALGARYKGKMCGAFGAAAILSFNGNKIITSSGGGMLLTNDSEMAEKALYYATQARQNAPYYQHTEVGFNYRLSNISAAIARGQFETLAHRIAVRREHYNAYAAEFDGLPLDMMPVSPDTEPNYWLSCAVLDKNCGVSPQELIDCLEAHNIEARRYWKPMHLQPLHSGRDYYTAGDGDVCGRLFDSGVCLPSGSGMTPAQRDRIIEIIKKKITGI